MTRPEADRGLSAPADNGVGLGATAVLPATPTVELEANEQAAPQARRGLLGRLFGGPTFAALAIREIRLLLIGNFMQFGAMQMQMLVRGVLVYDLTGSFAALGLVALANAVPGLFFSLLGGVVADRAPKKTVIQIAQWSNLVNAAILALLAGFGVLSFTHLMVSAVLQGGVNAIMMPSRQSIVADLVPRERITNAIALNTSVQNVMQLVGPGLGGALLAFMSPAAVFWFMVALYGGAIAFTVQLPKYPIFGNSGGAGAARRPGGLKAIGEGLKYVGADRTIRMILIVNFAIVILAFPYQMMLPGFVHEVLKKGPAAQGLLMSATGVGAIVGSLAVASIKDQARGRLLITYGMLIGVSLIIFAISTNFYLTLPIMLLVGVGMSGRMSAGQALIQSYSADEFRGRVTAVWMMQFSLVSFGTFGVGILSELVGPQMAIGGLAAILLVMMALVYLFVPAIRKLQ